MSPSSQDHASRRAQIRAIAAGIVDAPRVATRFRLAEGVRLQPTSRHRRSARRSRPVSPDRRRSPTLRRVIAGAFLVVQVAVLATLFTAPAFKVRSVEISGERILGRDALLAAAHVPQSSLFAVDSDDIRSRLSQIAWVRTVSVTTQLPNTVHIKVTEWQPDVVLRRHGVATLIASSGATLPVSAADHSAPAGLPVLLDDRTGAAGPLPAGMPDLLSEIAQRWPAVFGGHVAAVTWSAGGVLAIWSSAGWEAVLGHADSDAALADIPNQLAALAAVRTRINFTAPTFGYVHLENALEPAIGGHPGLPAWVNAELAGSAAAGPQPGTLNAPTALPIPATATPSATPTPVPTPRPSPTPLMLGVAPVSPTPTPGR